MTKADKRQRMAGLVFALVVTIAVAAGLIMWAINAHRADVATSNVKVLADQIQQACADEVDAEEQEMCANALKAQTRPTELIEGPPGPAGPRGPKGDDGMDGVSIQKVECIGFGETSYWEVVLSDGTVQTSPGTCREDEE